MKRDALFAFGVWSTLAASACNLLAGLEGERAWYTDEGEDQGGHGGAPDDAGGNAGNVASGGASDGGRAASNTGDGGELSLGGAAGHGATDGGHTLAGGSGGASGAHDDGGHAGGSVAGVAGEASGGEGGSVEPELGETPSPVSCRGATPPDACAGEDPCTTLPVEGGSFGMGRSDAPSASDAYPGAGEDELPEHLVHVSSFWLDRHEVSVGRFRRFVESYAGPPEAGEGAHWALRDSGWQSAWNERLPADAVALRESLRDERCNNAYRTWTEAPSNSECLPINCIDFYLAFAFCIWDEGRLPTEAEWEYAATAGEDRLYPWGPEPPDAARAVFDCTGLAGGSPDCSPSDIRPIGSRSPLGDGPFGHADLAGSMFERTRDAYDPNFYASAAASGRNPALLDPDDLDGASRGGNYVTDATQVRATARLNVHRTSRWDGVGFRCARNP